jgi:RNA polymerase primary sigma factor
MKGPETVGELIEGPALAGRTPANICRKCLELCSSILEHQQMLGGTENQADESTISAATRKLLQEKINERLSVLTRLEEDIIRLRYGLIDGYTYSHAEVGEKLGILPRRVTDIEAMAVAKQRLGSAEP